ncbi:hypothetical protein LOAG_03528 [Loa loa]|uniref:Uncharacterized protein n=1 Tax=Loa loa TaxID=7209 RepID=A0A1S0U660_LOALO|nr:hypothetical protein LOAG_03528 [Loa loa]EFO24953.1 hypothetical protein LOAG_03528 [Loa loa]
MRRFYEALKAMYGFTDAPKASTVEVLYQPVFGKSSTATTYDSSDVSTVLSPYSPKHLTIVLEQIRVTNIEAILLTMQLVGSSAGYISRMEDHHLKIVLYGIHYHFPQEKSSKEKNH